jgi:hypothetical protein
VAKKFILIDQSIASIAGHHYEYAVHVLEAAQRAGYEPYLATHMRFAKSSHQSPWKTFPLYRFSFWASQEKAQSSLVNWLLGQLGWMRFRWRLFYQYSLFGILWAVRDRFSGFLLNQPLDRAHLASFATLIPAAIFVKLLRWIGLLLLLPVMLIIFLGRSASRLLKAGGFPQAYVRSLLADPADAWSFVKQVWSRRLSYSSWWRQYQGLVAFRKDTERLLREVPAGRGDIVFIPTLSGVELMGLSELLKNRTPGPSWHLLFRRDIYPGREAGYPAEEWRVQGLRNSILGSAPKWKGHDVRFYTDTDELTKQHNRLGTVRFQTVPIPHTHRQIETQGREVRPLRCIYVGDARREKGYHWIPRIVEDLWTDYVATGRLTFHLQSNFNVPQGEPEAVIAREQLEQLMRRKPGAVELIKQPLTSDQYKKFLLAGDINLLLYDQNNYYARSSGILVESLTAGMPVIVPAGSWLARQFLPAVYCWQAGMRDRSTVIRSYRLDDLRWQVHGSARTNPIVSNQLNATHDGKAFTWIRINSLAGKQPAPTHLLIELHYSGAMNEALLQLEQIDVHGNSLTGGPRLLEGDGERRAVAWIELDPRCSKVWLALGSAPPAGSVSVRNLRVDLVAAGEYPRSAVGVIYQNPSELPALMRELLEHHDHYRTTASEFATGWNEYHNAARLVEVLAETETPQ